MRCLAVTCTLLMLTLIMLVPRRRDKTAAGSVVTAAPALVDRPAPARSSLTRPAKAFS
jgi:hypothetical protein